MRFVSPCILLASLSAFGIFSTTDGVWISNDRARVFRQFLNHAYVPDGHFNQRYWYNTTYYKEDGPVFLEIAGEWDPARTRFHVEAMCDYYAKELNALCLLLEHRYYGESAPQAIYASKNHPAGTFKFLSSDQAIEDVGRFIKWIKKRHPESNHGLVVSSKSKWVLFGCSYGGTLAAWTKQKFRDLIYAAVVSSAPLEAKLDFAKFNEGVQLRFHEGAPDDAWEYQQCTEFGWWHITGKMVYGQGEKDQLIKRYCDKFNENITVASLERAINDINRRHQGKLYFEERVIMVHGEDDVWKPAGISEQIGDGRWMPVIVIPKAKHCEDIKYPPRPVRKTNLNWAYSSGTDFDQLRLDIRAAQVQILGILRRWLQ